MSTGSFDSLWSYCTAKNRVCPMPQRWNDLFEKLTEKRRVGDGWEPRLPMILAAWHDTAPLQKQLRFREHIEWACDHGQLDQIEGFLCGLREEDWFHFGEYMRT